jgi:hypothetical protein
MITRRPHSRTATRGQIGKTPDQKPQRLNNKLSPGEVLAAWPDASRSRAVAGFVRAAIEVAASHAEQAAALA